LADGSVRRTRRHDKLQIVCPGQTHCPTRVIRVRDAGGRCLASALERTTVSLSCMGAGESAQQK